LIRAVPLVTVVKVVTSQTCSNHIAETSYLKASVTSPTLDTLMLYDR
jgi:hypothetical protein